MLCYQSSRDATEVIQHSFSWIASNFKALSLPVVPLLCLSLLIALVTNADGPVYIQEFIWGKGIELFLRPFTLATCSLPPSAISLIYVVAAFSTTVLFAPMLIRYFKERRSLTDLSAPQYVKILRLHLKPSLISGVAVATVMFVALSDTNLFFKIILLVALAYFIPNILLSAPLRKPVSGTKWLQIKSVTWLLLSWGIIQLFPFCINLVAYVVCHMLENLIPGLIVSTHEFDVIASMFLSAIIVISFCGAMGVFLVGSLLFHGAIYPIEQD